MTRTITDGFMFRRSNVVLVAKNAKRRKEGKGYGRLAIGPKRADVSKNDPGLLE